MNLKESILSKIIRGELPCYKIDEDDMSLSFLTLQAIQLGHSLVVPKIEIDHWFDLPQDYHLAVMNHAQKIAPAIKQATGATRIATTMIGLEVHHAHYHLLPIWSMDDLQFAKAKQYSEQENVKMLERIKSFL